MQSYAATGLRQLMLLMRFNDDTCWSTEAAVMNNAVKNNPVQRPSISLLGTEPWRAAIEFVSHKLAGPEATPTGDGHPVVIFPGLGTDGTAVAPLRSYCAALGYEAFDWGEGFNAGPKGDVDQWLSDLAERVSMSLRAFDQSATLIGWSLGGLYARELGKLLEPQVRQVITIGTPFNARDDHTNVGWLYRLLGGQQPTLDDAMSQRLKTPPPLPTTSIYSRSDGVVAWQTCMHDEPSSQVQDIEIRGSHIGMGWNNAALKIIGDRLAQPPGQWRRHKDAQALAS
jgi:predicted alpha/beta hydrolase family esterase